MNSGSVISLLIIFISIVVIGISIILSYKKTKLTVVNINDLNHNLNHLFTKYTSEGQQLIEKIMQLTSKTTLMQEDLEVKTTQLQDFSNRQHSLSESLLYLKKHSNEFSQGISTNLKSEIKEDGPKIIETFKRTFKKTFLKQKDRYKK